MNPLYYRVAFSYTISTGVPSVNGFLLFKDIPTAQREMIVGQPVECITTAVNEGARSISLRVSKKASMSAVIQGSSLTFNALNAGMLVNAIVADKVKVCPRFNFYSYFLCPVRMELF